MTHAKKLLARFMVFALIMAYIPTSATTSSAASSKVSTKAYTISKKAGTYSSDLSVTITAKKGYKVYYTTGSNLTTSKVIKSGKSKTIKISKTTTLKIYAVKKSTKITKKKLKSSSVKKKTKSYKYTIKADDSSTDSSSESTTTQATTTQTTTQSSTSTTEKTTETQTNPGGTQPTPPSTQSGSTSSEIKTEEAAQSELETAASTAASSTSTKEAVKGMEAPDGETTEINLSSLTASTEVSVTEESGTTTVTINEGGNYTLTGNTTNTVIEIPNSVSDTVGITLNNATIDNSALTSDTPIISSTKAPLVLTLEGTSTITGSANYTEEPANGIIYSKKAITITGTGTLNIVDSCQTTDFGNNDPSDGIASKESLVIESGVINVTSNGDCLKGTDTGITINNGTLTLVSNLGKGITSKNGLVTIAGGTTTINCADDGISAKNGTAQITGGTVKIGTTECGGDGIKAGQAAIITGGSVTIDNCYGDGIQAEDVVIADGTINIKTYYEYANTNFYKSNSVSGSSYNSETENESTGLKTETINYDTGSHKAIKAGTKAKTYSYTSVAADSELTTGTTYTQEASGGLTITGGTITLDTTATGIKYNGGTTTNMGGGDSKTIIGSPDDAIHSNNDATISGGTITIKSSDDGLSVVNNLYILNSASVDVQTAYEGIEASNIIIGTTNTAEPSVTIYSNDDGINAAKKDKVTYVYADESEETYTKTSYKTDDNSLTVNTGTLKVEIADDAQHSVTLNNKGESGTTYSFKANGDGIDCNGSFYAYGGNITVIGGTEGNNGAIDRDDNFVLGSGVTLFAIGSNGMVEGVTQADQAYIQTTSTSISKGSSVKISDANGNELYSTTAKKSAGFIMYSSPSVTSGSSYTLNVGSSSTTLTATTEASTGGMGGPGGNTPPSRP
ncbi:MAG: carbohydrate-binding domain-containing protein [Lachnospiraceae bacterium]|nr:carbohydrate-binding domain-containing protein [Lachnospiraceae bacterium]